MKTVCFWIVRSIPALEKRVSKPLKQDNPRGAELKSQWGQASLLRQLKLNEAEHPKGTSALSSGLVASLEKRPGDKLQGWHSTDHLTG